MKFRYRPLLGSKTTLIEVPVMAQRTPWEQTTADTRFAAAVASFGMQMREFEYKGSRAYEMVPATGGETMGGDIGGY